MKRIKKEHKEKIMEMIRKAGDPDNYETSWNDEGIPHISKKKSEIKKGRVSRASGARFELKVRGDLESKGNIVDKWNNNVDLESNKLVKAKRKYNPFKKMLIVGTGFPDFISIKYIHNELYSVVGVEVKMNGILSKTEKEKCVWYLKNKVFSRILIAKKWAPNTTGMTHEDVGLSVPSSTKKKDLSEKGKKRGQIEYVDFEEKYGKKFAQFFR